MRLRATLAAALLVLAAARPAGASILDGNFLCIFLGCAVTFNATDGEILLLIGRGGREARRIATIGTAPPTLAVETGTTTPVSTAPPAHGRLVGIDLTGDGSVDLSVSDGDGDGFLDASDSLTPFSVTGSAQVVLETTVRNASFYLCSSDDIDLYALATPTAGAGDIAGNTPLSSVRYTVSADQSGNDAGFGYGAAATAGGFVRNAGVNDLGDLQGAAVRIASLTSTVAAPDPDLADHCIRIDNRYDLPSYDLSQGSGDLLVDVEFFVYIP